MSQKAEQRHMFSHKNQRPSPGPRCLTALASLPGHLSAFWGATPEPGAPLPEDLHLPLSEQKQPDVWGQLRVVTNPWDLSFPLCKRQFHRIPL